MDVYVWLLAGGWIAAVIKLVLLAAIVAGAVMCIAAPAVARWDDKTKGR